MDFDVVEVDYNVGACTEYSIRKSDCRRNAGRAGR